MDIFYDPEQMLNDMLKKVKEAKAQGVRLNPEELIKAKRPSRAKPSAD